jgi:hypothetical protein
MIAANTISYMDYNLYQATVDTPPEWYQFDFEKSWGYRYTLAEMKSNYGFEQHSGMDSLSNIFSDSTNYVVRAPYSTGGRYGDTYGPRVPVGAAFSNGIMNVGQYGPAALPLPARTGQAAGASIRGRLVGGKVQ